MTVASNRRPVAPRVIDQQVTHGPCHAFEKVRAILPSEIGRGPSELAQPKVMQQASRIHAVSGWFARHQFSSELFQVVIDRFEDLRIGFSRSSQLIEEFLHAASIGGPTGLWGHSCAHRRVS